MSGRFKLAFLVFINQFFQFFAEYSAVIAAHLRAADKTRVLALDTDHDVLHTGTQLKNIIQLWF